MGTLDAAANPPTVASTGPAAPADARVTRTRRRRRPSGEPPPLPKQLNASGRWWLAAMAGVIAFWIVATATPSLALTVMVADHEVLERFASWRSPSLTPVMKAAGVPATDISLKVLWLANLAVLVYWRRWRHLIGWMAAGPLVSNVGALMAEMIQRPRPLGIEIIGPWKGFATPSLPVAVLATFLVCTIYPRRCHDTTDSGRNSGPGPCV